MKKLLLISNSTNYGQSYLEYCTPAIKNFLGTDIKKVLFIPFASPDRWDGYAQVAGEAYQKAGYQVESIHQQKDLQKAVNNAEAVFTGGGNTFNLLYNLYKYDLINLICQKVEKGMPYIGVSAGTNIACPTIKTTNDMPVIYPPSFQALNLIPFNINPHYLDPDSRSRHQGETRETRIKEFHILNPQIVVGLRESSWLEILGNKVILKGHAPARIFRKNYRPFEYQPESDLSFLLNSQNSRK